MQWGNACVIEEKLQIATGETHLVEVDELQSGEMQWYSYSSHGVAVLQYVQELHSSTVPQLPMCRSRNSAFGEMHLTGWRGSNWELDSSTLLLSTPSLIVRDSMMMLMGILSEIPPRANINNHMKKHRKNCEIDQF